MLQLWLNALFLTDGQILIVPRIYQAILIAQVLGEQSSPAVYRDCIDHRVVPSCLCLSFQTHVSGLDTTALVPVRGDGGVLCRGGFPC